MTETTFPSFTLPMHEGREVLTYSTLNTLRSCSKKFELRYHYRLSGPQGEALWLGSAVHEALEVFFLAIMKGLDIATAQVKAVQKLHNLFDGHAGDEQKHHNWHHAMQMVYWYIRRWSPQETGADPFGQIQNDEFEVIDVEREFVAPIINPETGAASKTFVMAGKVDGVVRLKEDGKLYVLEHKTSSDMSGGYFDKLWADLQSMLYAHYLGKHVYDETFGGVLYDVIGKHTRTKQKLEESENDFEERIVREQDKREAAIREKGPKQGESDEAFAERLAKYKTEATRNKHLAIGAKPGESNEDFEKRIADARAKKRTDLEAVGRFMGESDDDFSKRLIEKYSAPDSQHRELILFDSERLEEIEYEVWDMTKQIMAARRRGRFTMNTGNCFAFNRGCSFIPICRAGRLDEATAFGLEHRTPHGELESVNEDAKVETEDDLPF